MIKVIELVSEFDKEEGNATENTCKHWQGDNEDMQEKGREREVIDFRGTGWLIWEWE